MSEEAYLTTPRGDVCTLTYSPLDANKVMNSVASDEAGATAVFVGTTRNSFRGKMVIKLEYEAYTKLAMKTMEKIVEDTHRMIWPDPTPSHLPPQHHHPTNAHPHPHPPAPSNPSSASPPSSSIIRIAIHHRLGTVPVGEPSIVIAVSSPHRKEAFRACEWILEQVKMRVQIWKKECYDEREGGGSEWKANFVPVPRVF